MGQMAYQPEAFTQDLAQGELGILVTGCGRSGTKYTSFALKRLGLDVPHERLGRDGISSWTMAVAAEARPYGPPSSRVSFRQVFHQVREPLSTISSVLTFGRKSWDFISRHVDCPQTGSPLLRAASYWLLWNEQAERISTWRYRVEDLCGERLHEFCDRVGVVYSPQRISAIPRNFNSRRSGRLTHLGEEFCRRAGLTVPEALRRRISTRQPLPLVTWEMLDRQDPVLCARIRSKALQYGYA